MGDVVTLELLPEIRPIEEQAEPLRKIVLEGRLGKMTSEEFEKAQNQLRAVLKDETDLLFSLRAKIEEEGLPPDSMARFSAINLQIIHVGMELELISPAMRAERQRARLYNASLSDAAKDPLNMLNISPDLPPIAASVAGARDEIVAGSMVDIVHLVINDPRFPEKVAPEVYDKLRSDMVDASLKIMDGNGAERRREYERVVVSLKKLGVAAEGDRDLEHVLRVIEKLGAVAGSAEKAAEAVRSARVHPKQERLKV